MAEMFCFKRHPGTAVKCTEGPGHKGPHRFGDRLIWTDEEAQQSLALLAAGYGGVVSWPPVDRKRRCYGCKKEEMLRRCSCCEADLCHACLYKETCAHSTDNRHALPVERPMA